MMRPLAAPAGLAALTVVAGAAGRARAAPFSRVAAALTLNDAAIENDRAAGGAGGRGGIGLGGGSGGVDGVGAAGGNGGDGGNGGSGQGGGLFVSSTALSLNADTIAFDSVVGGSGGPGGPGGPGGTGGLGDGAAGDNGATGGGGSGQGGGIDNGRGLTVLNSTIADNSSSESGGGILNEGRLTITNSTIAYNNVANAGAGGGLDVISGSADLDNTIIALNTSGTGSTASASDIAGTADPAGAYNLVGTGGAGGLVNGVNGNQVGVANPGLGPLADNGGPTQTIALVTGSPAIDMGSNALAIVPSTGDPLTTDQRGAGFARIVNGTVDIGAYEVQSYITTVAVSWGTQTAALQTASDGLRLLPAGRSTDMPWLGIDQVQLTFTEAESLTADDITVSSAIGVGYGPVTVSGSGTSYTITLAQPINKADRLTITIGSPVIAPFTRELDVLPGDFNDDGVVNVQDLAGIRNEWLGIDGAKPTIFGDINGDGLVNVLDYNAERLLIGTSLPPASDVLLIARPASQGGRVVPVPIGTIGLSPPATASPAPPRAEIQLSGRGSSLGASAIGTSINQALIEKPTFPNAKRLTLSRDLRPKHRLSVRNQRQTDGHNWRSRSDDILHDEH